MPDHLVPADPGLPSRYLAARRPARAQARLSRAHARNAVGSERVRIKPQVQEAGMTSGLILLILIGALVAFGYTRLRGKMKLSVSGKNWIAPIVIVVIVALMLWASHNGH
jgi:hypothetical protein